MFVRDHAIKCLLGIVLVGAIGLTGCGSGAAATPAPPTEPPQTTATQIVPTHTPTPTVSATPTEAPTATPRPYADWDQQPDGSYVHKDHDNFHMELDEGSITFQVYPPATGSMRVSDVLTVVDSALADWGMTELERGDLNTAMQNVVTQGSGGLGTMGEKYLLGVGSGDQGSLVISLFTAQ